MLPLRIATRHSTCVVASILLSILCQVAAEEPILYTVPGLPADVGRYTSAVPLQGGWVIGTGSALLQQEGDTWSTFYSPMRSDISAVEPVTNGLVAAGHQGAWIFQNKSWRRLDCDDYFRYGSSDGRNALLLGEHAAYAISPDGRVNILERFPPGGLHNNFVHQVKNETILFTQYHPPEIWTGQSLIPAPAEFAWGYPRAVVSLQELPGGQLLALRGRGLYIEEGGKETPVYSGTISDLGVIAAYQFGKVRIACNMSKGVEIFSAETGQTLWSVSTDQIGTIASITECKNQVLLGTSSALYAIPNPDTYARTEIPKEDCRSSAMVNGKIAIALPKSAIYTNGESLLSSKLLQGLLQMKDGRIVRGSFGKIYIGDAEIRIKTRRTLGIAELPGSKLAVLSTNGIVIIDPSEKAAVPAADAVPIPSVPVGMAYDEREGIIVGTDSGVYILDNTASPKRHWGSGRFWIKQMEQEVIACSSTSIYDGGGRLKGTVPSGRIVSVTRWNGEYVAAAAFSDESFWVGRIEKETGAWIPLEIPTLNRIQMLEVENGKLLVIGPGNIISISRPIPLDPPESEFFIAKVGSSLPAQPITQSPSSTPAVELLFSPPRLGPWSQPKRWIKSGDADWEEVAKNATRATVNRLSWGRNKITVRAEWAGLRTETTHEIYREWPWWARWPTICGYIIILGSGVWLIVRLRTRALRLRAAELERLVDERTKELREAQRAREDFLSAVSHEIRNPLNGVVGICDMLNGSSPSELSSKNRSLVNTLKSCTDQLKVILDDVIDFTRIDRGVIKIHDDLFELSETLRGAAQAINPTLDQCSLQLPELPLWLRGDSVKIRQIVTNLVSNALKYGSPAAAHLKVDLVLSEDNHAALSIAVRNTGSTIAPEDLEAIFEGFVRTKDAVDRRIPGTGLGLAVSRRLARAMQGDLTVMSVNGLTEFRLSLKLPVAAPPANAAEDKIPDEIIGRALAIEDERYNRTVLGWHLTRMGYQVDWADTGAAALERVKSDQYDIIFTDIMLPDTTGDKLAKEIRALSENPKLPIIAVTAFSTPEKIEQMRAGGITGFVAKPISREKLQAAINGAAAANGSSRRVESSLALEHDFSALLRMSEGQRLLAEYSEALSAAWTTIQTRCAQTLAAPDETRRLVHALRSQVLVARALPVAEQLALLEDAVAERREADAHKLLRVIAPMIDELARAAKAAAVAELISRN